MRKVYGYACIPGNDCCRGADAEGRVIFETIVATEAGAIIRLVQRLNGPLRVTFEETTQAAWLYEILRGYVTEVIVCDPRRNKLLSEGSKADKADARKLAELLKTGMLRSVYHGHEATRKLKELVALRTQHFCHRQSRWTASHPGLRTTAVSTLPSVASVKMSLFLEALAIGRPYAI